MEPSAESPAAPPAPVVADGVEHALDPRSITVNRISGGIFLLLLAGGSLAGLLAVVLGAPLPMWGRAALVLLWLLALAGIGWFGYRWPVIAHRYAAYRVDARGIEIRRGVVWRRVINVPRSRVQHTDVAQGPLERHYGLGTLVIYTAGTDHAKVDLPGLDHRRALLVRDHLLPDHDADGV